MSRFLLPYFAAAAAGKQVSFSRERNWGVIDGTLYSTTEPVKLPTVTITTAQTSITEGTTATWTISVDEAFDRSVFVLVNVSQVGSFVNSLNLGEKRVTFTAGTTSQTYTLQTINDTTNEDTGSVSLSLKQAQGVYSVGTQGNVSITVIDDDEPANFPTFIVRRVEASIEEGNPVRWEVSASPAPNRNISLLYRLTQVGTHVPSSEIGNKSIDFLAGRSSQRILVNIPDTLQAEGGGSATLSLRGSTTYRVGTPSSATISITDNELTYALSSSSTINLNSANGWPIGLAVQNAANSILVVDNVRDRIYQYNSTQGFLNSWPLPANNNNPVSIRFDARDFFDIIDLSDRLIYTYRNVIAGSSLFQFEFGRTRLHSSNSSPVGSARSGGGTWVLDSSADKIFKYQSNTLDSSATITLNSSNSDPRDMVIDPEGNFWILDGDGTVYNYTPSGVFGRAAFTLSSSNSNPVGIGIDNNGDFWIVDRTADRIFKYVGS